MPVTIQDVADAAGVSLSTVSRALTDSPRVKVATRQRIQQLAKEMGYTPSALARGLATRRTSNLGIVVRDIADLFMAELVREIDRSAQEHGYSLILAHGGDEPERELMAINLLRQQRVDAIIVPDPSVADSILPLLDENSVPVVLINNSRYPLSVGTDNYAAAQLGVDHLYGLGHRCIAYIGGARNRGESEERRAGFEASLAEYGIPPHQGYIYEGDGWSSGGRSGMNHFLQLPEPPTAVLCFNDLTAIGAIGVAHARGMRVPRDVSIVGFDDISLCPFIDPPLTTIAQSKESLAPLAVKLALEQLQGGKQPRSIVLPGKLVIRGSTSGPRS